MAKTIIYIRRPKGRDEEKELNTDFNFKVGDEITFPDRIARTNAYHGIKIVKIKYEIRERKWHVFDLGTELVILVEAEEL